MTCTCWEVDAGVEGTDAVRGNTETLSMSPDLPTVVEQIYVHRTARKYRLGSIADRLGKDTAMLLQRLPESVESVLKSLRQIGRGQFTVTLDTTHLSQHIEHL